MATKTKITFTLPDGGEKKYSLDRSGIYHLGTSSDCDIELDDPALKKKHGKLVADETNDVRWFLQTLEDGAISFLEHGSKLKVGNTQLKVSVTELPEEEAEGKPESGADPDDANTTPAFGSDDPTDNESQLEQLQKAQRLRELKSAIILIIACGLIAFAAGVAWRLLGIPPM